MNAEAKCIVRVSKTVQVWYWPTLPQPYRVQTRLPGRPYRLHSAHDTQAEAEVEAVRVSRLTAQTHAPLRERLCTPMTVGEASVVLATVL